MHDRHILRLLTPALLLAAGLACDAVQPQTLDGFGDDTYVPDPDDDDTDAPSTSDDTDRTGQPGGNAAPHASINPQRVDDGVIGETVYLDGSGSSDADGDPLTYRWDFSFKPGGSRATLQNDRFSQTSFTPDVRGQYEVRLIVNDGKVDSPARAVQILVEATNTPPVANAGNDQTTIQGSLVQLSGALSEDPDGDRLVEFQWVLNKPPGSNAYLVGIDVQPATSPRFTADAVGTFTADLKVYDGEFWSEVDSVRITVNANDPGGGGGGGSDDCLSCAEGEDLARRWTAGDAAHGGGMALLPLLVLFWRRRDPDA